MGGGRGLGARVPRLPHLLRHRPLAGRHLRSAPQGQPELRKRRQAALYVRRSLLVSIAPKCECGHSRSNHVLIPAADSRSDKWLACKRRCECWNYTPKRPLSSVRTATPKKPKCICGHAKKLHTCAVGCTDDWCEKCGAECQTYIASAGPFVPSRSVRTSAPKRKARPAKKRKTSLAAAKRTLWDYFAAYVKARDGNVCFTCDAFCEGASRHAGHMFAGRTGALLYDPLVVYVQCAGCNRGRRGHAAEFARRYIDRFGIDQFQAAVRRTTREKHWTLPEVRELIEALKAGGAAYESLYMEKHGL
jgi:hypothetical protein